MPDSIDNAEGRHLFGSDPANYAAIRPDYPDEIYQFLIDTGALRPNCKTLEIGAGTGLATRKLLELGANPLTAIEPDARFSAMLEALADSRRMSLELVNVPFEEAALPTGSFDLIAAATSFHWIDRSIGLLKAARLLKVGGHLALLWNVFGDPLREDPYHEATQHILGHLRASPSGSDSGEPRRATSRASPDTPFALDIEARVRDLADTGAFDPPAHRLCRWTLVLDTQQVGALYATFSPISQLPAPEARAVLTELMDVATTQFEGRVERNMVSIAYVAKRSRPSGEPHGSV
jgi:SAM-dependent methyltransferase